MAGKRESDTVSPRPAMAPPHAKEDWLRVMFNHANDGVLLIDPADDRVMEANLRATEILDASFEALREMRPSSLFPELAERLRDLARDPGPETGLLERVTLLPSTAKKVSVELSIASVCIEDKPCLITILRDTTERDQVERRLRSSLKENRKLVARLEALYEAEQQITKELRAVNSTAAKVNSILNPDQLLSHLAMLLHETFGYYFVGIHLLEPGDGQLTLRATAGGPSSGPRIGRKTRLGSGIVGNSAKKGAAE